MSFSPFLVFLRINNLASLTIFVESENFIMNERLLFEALLGLFNLKIISVEQSNLKI